MKIVAAVVTYNRCELLERCVNRLQMQTRAPDLILVINNSSTDATEEMLRRRKISHITQRNTGSAGGWARSIQYAMENDFDAVWLMDDDGYPDENALGTLEAAMKPDVACASSVVLCEHKPTHFVFPMPLLDTSDLPVLFGVRRKIGKLHELRQIVPNGTYPFAHLFNGALLSIGAARKIQNVNHEFFVFGDEVDYFFRLREVGRVLSVLDAKQYHPDVRERPYTPAKVYYYIKNTLIINSLYLNAVPLRNILAIFAALGRTARRNSLLAALSYPFGLRAPLFYRAIARGLRGQIGRDFHD